MAGAQRAASADRVVIVGAGLAGLFTALKLTPLPVTVIASQPLGRGASSGWAQAGIAAAIGEGDTVEAHAADTIRVGGGIVDEGIAHLLAREAADRLDDLLAYGVPFDRDLEGRLALRREAAHSARRIASVKGDMAGRQIMAALIAAVRQAPHIVTLEGYEAEEIALSHGQAAGVVVRQAGGTSAVRELVAGPCVVLATGGIGRLYAVTTNAADARGEGLAMALRAGAAASDVEFVQFHPTAIDVGRDPAPLATEALRGEGATLVDAKGDRLMAGIHPDGDLAPRDIVARAVHAARAAGRGAFLDCRGALGRDMAESFPTVHGFCREAGLDPEHDLIPVAPAAHFHMGGVLTDARGRTTLDGLWACGEVAATGTHGANRLASNSLLEAVVFGARVAEDISGLHLGEYALLVPRLTRARRPATGRLTDAETAELRQTMSAQVGVARDRSGLAAAEVRLERLAARLAARGLSANALISAQIIARAALLRTESRGAHFRTDFPKEDPAQARRSVLELADLAAPLDGHERARGAA